MRDPIISLGLIYGSGLLFAAVILVLNQIDKRRFERAVSTDRAE